MLSTPTKGAFTATSISAISAEVCSLHVVGRYGAEPLIVVLARGLKSSWLLAEMDLVRDLYTMVLQPMYMEARAHEGDGGARYILKVRSFRIELFERLIDSGVEKLKCWDEVLKLKDITASEDEEVVSALTRQMLFKSAAERVLEGSLEKSLEQRGWSATHGLLISLADEDLALDVGLLVHGYLVEKHLAPALAGAAAREPRAKYS